MSSSGLFLRTDPNAGSDAGGTSKVVLLKADEIVMDDGALVRSWPRLEADLNVGGVGGLDQGAPANLAWYETHVVRKSACDARGLILKRRKQYVLDQQQASGVSVVGLRDSATRTAAQQSFAVSTSGPVEIIDVPLGVVGSPNGHVWLKVEDTAGTTLATSDKVRVNALASSPSGFNVRFVFRSPVSIAADTPFNASLYGDFPIDGANYVRWYCGSGDTYGRGVPRTWDGSTWTQWNSNDMAMKVYVTRFDDPLVLPEGYDQKQLVGHFLTSSLFDPMWWIDRKAFWQIRSTGTGFENFSNPNPVVVDSTLIFPHGLPVICHCAVKNTVPGRVLVAGVPDGHSKQYDQYDGGVNGAVDANGRYIWAGPVPTEYGGMYVAAENGSGTVMVPSWEW